MKTQIERAEPSNYVLTSGGPAVPFELVYDSIREQLDDLGDEENALFIAPVGATLEQVNEAMALCKKEIREELEDA